MTWTFDPLVRRNAYFNTVKLAARPVEYLVDFYGEMTDEINAGQGSDRLLVEWPLLAPEVVSAAAGDFAGCRARRAPGRRSTGARRRRRGWADQPPGADRYRAGVGPGAAGHRAAPDRSRPSWAGAGGLRYGRPWSPDWQRLDVGGCTRDGWYVLVPPAPEDGEGDRGARAES